MRSAHPCATIGGCLWVMEDTIPIVAAGLRLNMLGEDLVAKSDW